MSASARAPLGRWLVLLAVVLLASGCASLPGGVARTPSQAIPPTLGSTLGRVALSTTPAAELTGFRLLPSGAFALDARLALIRRAERSLDLQYYQFDNDGTGRMLMRALRDAAGRGVRVRLLVDDLYTADTQALLAGLAASPNVEVRLFNPFPAGRGGLASRFLASLTDFSRVNRRMHNKLFIADGAMAVTGGRNIADTYFNRGEDGNFIDMDGMLVGGAVWQLMAVFDAYWNSPVVYPLQAIVPPAADAAALRARFDRATQDDAMPAQLPDDARDVLGHGPVGQDIDAGWLSLVWARAEAYADPPAKITGETTQYAGIPLQDVLSVRFEVLNQIRQARHEVLVNSPYLIPGDKGVALFSQLVRRGVDVSLLTNSLATTDEPLVAMGYRRYREALVRGGVQLFELSPQHLKRDRLFKNLRGSVSRLHAKTVVIDQRLVFFGSMNFDERSASVNTEMGVFADSPQLAEEMRRLMRYDRQHAALQVRLSDDGQGLRWLDPDADAPGSAGHDEPGADAWSLLWLNLLLPLAPEDLL